MKKGEINIGNGKVIFDPELADMCERSNQRFDFVRAELDQMWGKFKVKFPTAKRRDMDYFIFNSIHCE